MEWGEPATLADLVATLSDEDDSVAAK